MIAAAFVLALKERIRLLLRVYETPRTMSCSIPTFGDANKVLRESRMSRGDETCSWLQLFLLLKQIIMCGDELVILE